MASSAIKSVQQMGELLGKEAKFLYNIQDKINSLRTELEWMECFLEDTNGRQHNNKLLGKWVAQITEFQHLAEDLVEDYLCLVPLRQDSGGIWNTIKWFSNLVCACHGYKVHSLGSKVDDLIIKIADLNSRLKRYGVKLTRPTESVVYYAMRGERPTYSHIEGGVVGLEKDVQEVVHKLTKTEVKVVGIAGVEGLGKSALARKVFVDNAIKRHFRYNCVWVCVAKDQTSIRNVFEKIISGLISTMAEYNTGKNDVKDLEDVELADKIHEVLQKKECFVVLDDILREGDWDALKPVLGPIESSRTKILLTTNNQGLLQHVDSNAYAHPLRPLCHENSWELLQGKAFPRRKRGAAESPSTSIQNETDEDGEVDATEKPKMMELGRKMVKYCHGLPLAIAALGGILSTKRIHAEWKDVENNISPYLMTDMWAKNNILAYLMTDMWGGSETGEILSVLELSYDALPFYLRACFLYLASFPQDYEISIKRLYCLWEAEGLLQIPHRDDTRVVTCFDMGDRYLMELMQRSVVQMGKCSKSERIKSCRIHDLMRGLCIRKCKEESFLNVQKEVITETERQFRRHALHLKDGGLDVACLPQHGKQARCIRSLLAFQLKASKRSDFDKKKWLNMVKRFPMVRVLDLQDAKIDIKVLKVGHLVHLRYLNLRDARVEKVASCIGDLTLLVTLDLRVQGKIQLPNKFHRMKSLRHLYLPREFSVKYEEKLSFGALPIETLKNFCPANCVMKDIEGMESLRVFKTNDRFEIIELKVFEELPLLSSVCLQVAMELIDKDPRILRSVFKGNRCFVELKLNGRSEEEYPDLVNAMARGEQVFPRNLRHLTIRHCTLPGEGIVELGMLDNLKNLILDCVHVGNKITFSDKRFLRLNTLTLRNCDLEECEVRDGALPNLQRLKLHECRNLKSLPRGLPDSVDIDCYNPCIKGIEEYNSCPHFKPSEASSDASACT